MKERIKQSGVTLYHEQIKDAQDILKYGFCDDVSYNPNIVSYNSNNEIPIKIYDQKFSASYGVTAKYLTMHNNFIELGQLLYDNKKKEYWMCIESYEVSGIHNEGKLGKCNRFLKWQDKYGSIKEIPAIITTASKYNNGENGTEIVYIGSDQLMIFLPLNQDTIQLDRNINFLIDENKNNPTVYRITRVDTTLYTYMGKGFISIIVTESQYKPSQKEIEIGILVCRTGIGMSIAANKVKGIRCAKINSEEDAILSRNDNGANVMTFNYTDSMENIKKYIDAFLSAEVINDERHQRRIDKITRYENER